MPKVPEFTRQIFASRQQPGNIGAVQGQFQEGAKIAGAFAQLGQEVQRQRDVESTANFNNSAETLLGERDIQLRNDPNIQRNPFLYRQEIQKSFQELKQDSSFTGLSAAARQAANTRLNNLSTDFNIKAAAFEVRQHGTNAVGSIREGRQNYDLQALTTDEPVEKLADKQANLVRGFVQSGAISVDQGEQILQDDLSSIYSNRAQQLINTNQFDAAREFIQDKDNQGVIGANKLNALFNEVEREEIRFEREQQIAARRDESFNTIQKAIDLEIPLDPKDRDTKQAIDIYYEDSEIASGLAQSRPEAAEELAELSGKIDILPTKAVSTLRAQLRNGDVEQRVFAAEAISKLQEQAPRSLDSMDTKDLRTASIAVSYIRAGIQPNKAFEFVDEQLAPQNELVIKERKKNLNKQDINFDDEIENNFDDPFFKSFFTIAPQLPSQAIAKDAIVADYKNTYTAAFLETGDQETALNFANETIKRQYGVSNITGKKTIMKYAPENYYGIQGVDNKWITKDLQEDIKLNLNKEVDLDKVLVIGDFNTAREASAGSPEPSYQVLVETELGTFEPLIDEDNNILRYKPDRAKQIARIRKQKEKEFEEASTRSRAKRERRIAKESIISPEEQEIEQIARSATGIGL